MRLPASILERRREVLEVAMGRLQEALRDLEENYEDEWVLVQFRSVAFWAGRAASDYLDALPGGRP